MNVSAAIGPPLIPSWVQLRCFSAEIWLIITIVAVLFTPFFTRRSNLVCALVALAGVLLALGSLLIVGAGDGNVGSYFNGFLVFDRVAFFWKIVLLLFVAGVILMTFGSTLATLHKGDGPEFFTLLLGATLGMSLMASTSNLLMLFMATELASLPSYVLAGFRKTHRVGAEASLKYVLFGSAVSAVMVYCLSLLYGLYGSLQIADIATHIGRNNGGGAVLVIGILGIIVGTGFKISAVPFHLWVPDVFEGASIDVTTFLSVASKGAGLILLLRVVETLAAAQNFAPGELNWLATIIGVMGAITITVGNTAAFIQKNIKRLLAYSSIAQAGYMLCALSLVVRGSSAVTGFDPAFSTIDAVLLYLAAYAVMNLGAFSVAAAVGRDSGEQLADFRGLGRRAPVLAACMFACLVSLIGLPPVAGFGAKLNLLWALFQDGGWWWVLIVVIAVNTVISAFYYFRVIRAMYLEAGDSAVLSANPILIGLSIVCGLLLVGLFFGFGGLSRLVAGYSHVYLPVVSIAR